jgi:L-lactate dehydrogenase (cytochrome)
MIGRAYVYGLGAAGEEGVAKAIALIRNELDTSMALTGTTSLRGVGREIVAGA